MKKSIIILLVVVLGVSACAPVIVGPPTGPTGFAVAVEDRPYYVRGPYYVEQGRRWVWVGGHWSRRHGHRIWIRGHYILR